MKNLRWWNCFLSFLSQGPPEIEPIPKLSVATIQKGDVLVVSIGQRLSPDRIKHVKDLMHQTFRGTSDGGDCKVLVLDGGAELGIVRPLKSQW